MPVYSFKCAKGHVSDGFFSMKNMPDAIPCACGETAPRTFTAPSVGIVAGSTNPCRTNPHRAADAPALPARSNANAFRCVDYACSRGHKDFDVVHQDADWTAAPCKVCGDDTFRVWAMPALDAWTERGLHASGGEWNASLGRWIKSPEHLREVCAEMQVRPSEEDSGELLRQAERKAREDAEDREVFEMFQQEDASIKKARDQGLVPDDTWAMKAVEAAHPDW
jgi:predicted nucleic acid-binding Zn ribbon protein